MSDSLKIWGTDYTGVKGFKASDTSDNQYTYIHPQGAKSISQNGEGIDVSEYASVNVRVQGGSTTEITISDSGAVSQELQPSTVYHFTSTALTSLTITFAQNTGQYHFDFISPSTAVVLTIPLSVEMPSSFGVEANTKYEIDILDNYGVAAEWIYEVV